MKILGIDPGLDRTGLGCIDVGVQRPRLMGMECITTSPRQPLPARLHALHDGLRAVVRGWTPDVVVLESLYAHYRHPTTAILMGHARGVICQVAASCNVVLVEYLPTRVKKAVVGHGHARKDQVQGMVTALLQLSQRPEPNDIADALALALCHAHVLEHDQSAVVRQPLPARLRPYMRRRRPVITKGRR